MPPENLEREVQQYVFVVSSINTLSHCEKILKKHSCAFSGFVFLCGDDVGRYSFRKPLEKSVLEELKGVCEVYTRV